MPSFLKKFLFLQQNIWVQTRAYLIWVYEGKVMPRNRIIHSYIPNHSAFLLRKGHLAVEDEFGKVVVKEGEWVFLRPGYRKQVFQAKSEILSIRFHYTPPGNVQFFDWETAAVLTKKAPQLEAGAKQLRQTVEQLFPGVETELPGIEGSLQSYFLIQEAFFAWFRAATSALQENGYIIRKFSTIDPRVFKALEIMERSPLNQPLPDKELAKNVYLSPSQLDRLFVKQFGLTPRQYQERQRLEYAVERIQHSQESIKEIAYDLGFISLSHFSTWLQRKIKMSPRQLRQQSAC